MISQSQHEHAKAIAILGTGSDVGKSVIAAGLCRLLYRRGLRVAPFKAQNMSLNSYATLEGGEIGRAQALQAEACGLQPHVDMNPILLKPESDTCSQVIVQGKVFAKLNAQAYYGERLNLFRFVEESYRRLSCRYDVMVIEGAGSAAEVNLRGRDLVNWPMVKLAGAEVVLVGDIDRGGIFAQIIGTLDLLEPSERQRVRGIVVNRFRGDVSLFDDGVKILEKRTGVPVLGVVPFLRELTLDQEDSIQPSLHCRVGFERETVNIAVLLLPRMSNFTDFNALAAEHDVALRYVASPAELDGADVIVIPGSKNTLGDLAYLKSKGFSPALQDHVKRPGELVGICAGYQMLGIEIRDPHGIEAGGSAEGLGFLDTVTELQETKITIQVEAFSLSLEHLSETIVRGYQIHMGSSMRARSQPCFRINRVLGKTADGFPKDFAEVEWDGAVNENGRVWGTYIHGIFDQPRFRRAWLNRMRTRKGLPPVDATVSEIVTARMHNELDRWADHVERHVDLTSLLERVLN